MDSAKEEGTSWEDEGSFGVVTCRDMQGDDEAFEEDGQDDAWWKDEEEDEWKDELQEETKHDEQSQWHGWYSVKREGGGGWAKRQKASSWSSWQPWRSGSSYGSSSSSNGNRRGGYHGDGKGGYYLPDGRGFVDRHGNHHK
eukprot:s8202_g4.t1